MKLVLFAPMLLSISTVPVTATPCVPKATGIELDRPDGVRLELRGWLRQYTDAIITNWLLVAPDSNPAMLQMFRDRDRLPYRSLIPAAGEFAGKYLTGAVEVYQLTHNAALRSYLKKFVAQLISCQAEDGYLGPFPKEYRLTGWTWDKEHKGYTWDMWGHYHAMLGLILWYDATGDRKALDCARRIGDLLCTKFLDAPPDKRIVDISPSELTEMNLAPVHSLCLLYEKTGEARYLELARQIADEELSAQGPEGLRSGDYIRAALAGKELYEMPRTRWEGLHPIMGILELYRITGGKRYRQAFEHIWWSIVKLDRHNNGGFSSNENAQGNPYSPYSIETCCTIAWAAMSVEMLRLTGNSIVADELELSTLNSVLGAHSPTGRWVTYHTGMDGVRKSSAQASVWQSREGSPELNCCSVNGARGLGLVSEWALMESDDGLALNYYGPSTMSVKLWSGNRLTIEQKTRYPADGRIDISVSPSRPERFKLMLRIPYWSLKTRVTVNGEWVGGVSGGRYLVLDRKWQTGDRIAIDLDMTLHYWVGEREREGRSCAYRGPIVLTYDRYYNDIDPDDLPVLDARKMDYRVVSAEDWQYQPLMLLEFTATDGRKLRLCDFASAGYAGTPYKSWIFVDNVHKTEFSRSNPLRSGRPQAYR